MTRYKQLRDDDTLLAGDETARLSLLRSGQFYEGWSYVEEDAVGLTIAEYKKNDMDAAERVFRRLRPTFDIPFDVVNADTGKVVGRGVFKDCRITHISHGAIDSDVMKTEPIDSVVEHVLPDTNKGKV